MLRAGRASGPLDTIGLVVAAAAGRPPVRRLPYVAVGGALGVAVRELCSAVWPMPAQRCISVLLFALVASFALGWVLTVQTQPCLLAAVWGWSGALCSISVIATFVLGVPPVWALSCLALVPLTAAAGVATGAIVGIRRRQRCQTTDATPA